MWQKGYDDFFSKRQTVKIYITLKCTNRPCFTYDSEIAVVNSPFLWHHIFSISLALLGSSIVLAWVCFYWDYIKASALVFFCHHKWFGQELVCQVTNLDITKYGHCFWEGWELIRIQLFWFNYLYHLSIQSLIISHGFWLGSHWLHLESHHNRDLSKFYAKITACCVVKCLGIFPLFAVISVEVVTQKSSVLHILYRTLFIKVMHHST